MRKVLLASLFGFTVVNTAACRGDRPSQTSSQARAIATDLPDDGGAVVSSLYYTNNGVIFRGVCDDPQQLVRYFCQRDLVSMRYDTFKAELDGGLSDSIRALSAEAKRIESAIASIEKDLADARQQLNLLEQQQGGLSAELETLRNNIKGFEIGLEQYRQQLALIDRALAQVVDLEIAAMRPIVLARLKEWQERMAQVNGQIQTILEQFSGLHTQIEQIGQRVSALTTRSQNLQRDLAGVNLRLDAAYGDFSVYTATLMRLDDGITYAVWSSNTLLLAQRRFIRRFEAIFARHT